MSKRSKKIKQIIHSNTNVIENYLFMTSLQVFSSLIGIIIYPYLIRTMGAESYGMYILAFTISTYFITLVTFGFNFPAIKAVVLHKEDYAQRNEIISQVFTAKVILILISIIIFTGLVYFIPFLNRNWLIFSICFCQIFGELLFPNWFYQAIQKMRIVTIVQLTVRLLSIPFVFIFIKSPQQNWIYALIGSSAIIIASIILFIHLRHNEGVRIRIVPLKSIKKTFEDAAPFFWSAAMARIKEESITLILATFFSLRDVAIYDLANKIVSLPQMLTINLNRALFPKTIQQVHTGLAKKIIYYETILGIAVVLAIIIFGKWLIILLGGNNMIDAYPFAIILSFKLLTWLLVESYVNYVFVPNSFYKIVSKVQLISFISFTIGIICSIFFFKDLYLIVFSLTLSGIIEVIYSKYIIKKYHLI